MKRYIQHIILISIDTLRADCINASPRAKGYLNKYKVKTSLRTECLDKILRSGLYFNNCFSAAPYTSASHAAYFTGMWPLKNGIYEFFNRKLVQPTIFQYAKKQGYTTIFQTDFPVILGQALGFTSSVDHYFIENEDKAFQTLVKNNQTNTLSFFHFGGVHYPYGFHTLRFGGKDYINKVNSLEKKYHVTNKGEQKLDDILTETFRNRKDTELLLRYKYIIFEKLYKQRLYNHLFDLYLEGINYFLEHRFKKFIFSVKNFVDKNNAILFIFSDHGEEWDDYSEGHHNTLSDNVLRVPLMVYSKWVKPKVEERLIRTIDLAPTIIDLLPYPIKTNMDGFSLNIFKSNSAMSLNKTKYAISQVYTSIATKKQIADYQNMSIKNNKKVKPLNTYLSGEAIRTEDKKYVVYYQKDGSISRNEVLGDVNRLRRILVNYNKLRVAKKNKLSNIELKIKNELRNLGYQV
jgi:arylsulfatase A-like enzyme